MIYEIMRINGRIDRVFEETEWERLCYVDNLDQAKAILAAFLEKNEDDTEVEVNTIYPYRYNPSLAYVVEEFE